MRIIIKPLNFVFQYYQFVMAVHLYKINYNFFSYLITFYND